MVDRLGSRQGMLHLAEPDPDWAVAYAQEAARIRAALTDTTIQIEHIGSTAVPDLAAKPILDIAMQAVAPDHDRIAATLVDIGYIDRGERSGRLFIRLRDGDTRTHNLHLYATGDAEFDRQILFRDRLRADPALRQAYAAEKARIIRQSGGRRGGYAEAKGPFIAAALIGTRY